MAYSFDRNVDAYVPKRFAARIAAHAYIGGLDATDTALILGIHGPPGYGKSFQVRQVAERWGMQCVSIAASALAGKLESEPVQALEANYVKLSARLAQDDAVGFLLIDDFDMGIAGLREGTTYTVNSQILTSFLMALCDDPFLGGRLRRSVPIVLTGNNLGVLYAPLTRHGRMDLMQWLPSLEEKREVVQAMFRSLLDADSSAVLVDEFKQQPVSFFSQLIADLQRGSAARVLDGHGTPPSFSEFKSELSRLRPGALQDFIDAGRKRAEAAALPDHLRSDQFGGSDE